MKKKLPNLLTIFRIFLTPIFFLILISSSKYSFLFALLIFIVASITDFFDGKLARKYNAISKFGLFMDPLADKILVLSAFIGFLYLDILNSVVEPWMVILIFSRDILVTLLRLIMKKNGILMITSKIAKLKTTTQLISIIIILTCLSILSFGDIGIIDSHIYAFKLDKFLFIIKNTMIIVTLFTLYTGIDYYYRNIKLIIANR